VSYRPERAGAARLARSAMAAGPARCPAASYMGPRAAGTRSSGPVDVALVAAEKEDRPDTRRKTIAACP